MSCLCLYQSSPTRLGLVRSMKKAINLRADDPFIACNYSSLNPSGITSHFTDSLVSFKPNHQLAAVGHDCAHTTAASVMVVPGYGQGCALNTSMRNHDTVSAMFAPCYLTDTGMFKRINKVLWPFYMNNIYTYTQPAYFLLKPVFILSFSPCLSVSKRNILKFVCKFIFTL